MNDEIRQQIASCLSAIAYFEYTMDAHPHPRFCIDWEAKEVWFCNPAADALPWGFEEAFKRSSTVLFDFYTPLENWMVVELRFKNYEVV